MIVVTTPTGAIGSQVLGRVVESGERIRVIARDPSRLPPRIRSRVEVVQGSHGEFDVVDKAFAGADAVFWLAPPNFRAPSLAAAIVDFTRPACQAIRTHEVKRVVAVSNLGRGSPLAANAGHVTASLAMEDLIASTGVSLRALTLPGFMDNMLMQTASIRELGAFFSPASRDSKRPMCATRDVAAIAARLLTDSSWTGRQSVPLLGPEDLTLDEMAQIMTEVLGKPVRFQEISSEAFRAGLLERGASEAVAQGMVDMFAAKNAGLDNFEPRTPEATTPTTFRHWCEDVLKPAVLG